MKISVNLMCDKKYEEILAVFIIAKMIKISSRKEQRNGKNHRNN